MTSAADSPFDTPLLSWIGRRYDAIADYVRLFKSAKPKTMGESPYLQSKDAGIAFALWQDHSIRAIHLYAKGVEGFSEYTGALPAALTFSSARAHVTTAMGAPAMSAEAGGSGIFAIEHSFDRFEAEGFYIRFEYFTNDAGVRLVTLGKVEA
jgi:hypothetical protein